MDKLAAGSDTDGAAVDFRDCRTFGNEKHSFVLATQVDARARATDHNLLYQWMSTSCPARG